MVHRLGIPLWVVAILATPAHAQVSIDMTKVICADYTAMPPVQTRDCSAWMSGWFNQKINGTTLNVQGYARNVENVKGWCASNPKESVMAGLQRAAPAAPVRSGRPMEIDMSLITCKQFSEADPDRTFLLHAWMAGYYSATKTPARSTSDMQSATRR